MTLVKVSDILKHADKEGYGVAAFNAFNYESIAWLIKTAEEENTPVIVMLYPACSKFIPVSTFAAIAKDLASKVKVPVGLHLDHSNSFEQIMSAIADGFTSVMIDGSSLAFEENIRATREVVKAAHAMDIDVEAELGFVGRASNINDFKDSSHYTNPDSVVEFIERTGADSLAVSIGSAHGNYVAMPRLDIKRLSDINKVTDTPLVLHGGSGIPDDQIKEAVKHGINKLNIGTEFNQLFYSKTEDLDKEYITSAKFLHLSHMDPVTCQAAIWAKEKGVRVVFDGDSYSPDTEKNYELIDVFIGSEFYYKSVFKDEDYEKNCRAIQHRGPDIVVFTLGERGCLGIYGSNFFKMPAFNVDVVDTTGAGDVYHGAFIYGLLQGWDIEMTAKFANAVSAIKCTRIGGRAGIPNLEIVERFLKDGYIDYTEIDQRVQFYRDIIFK